MKFDYLLRYVSMNTYNKILESNEYILRLLKDNSRDINLNIKYLVNYGVSNIERYIFNNLEDLIISHDEFINKINEYEEKYTKEEIITLLENK